jgi:hypothetical protein
MGKYLSAGHAASEAEETYQPAQPGPANVPRPVTMEENQAHFDRLNFESSTPAQQEEMNNAKLAKLMNE